MEGGGSTAVASPPTGQGFFHRPRLPYREKNQFYKHHHYYNRMQGDQGPNNATNFDGKRMRKSITRKTVDYNSSVIKLLESRIWQRDSRDIRWIQPDPTYTHELSLPETYLNNPINAVTTRFVRTSTNKIRCPIFCCAWTPEGRRLVTGASSGEFTLWNGLTFNFETILQAHDYPVRAMTWSHNDLWLMTADHLGYVKYWQSNMNNVKMYQAHKDQPIRGVSFSPTDTKFTTCADDGTVRIFDFMRCHEERVLRGHGAEVKCIDWHPQKGLIVSGSKDSQQPVKLWDPRSNNPLATLHAHKSTVMAVKFNQNGSWLLTASRDHVCKLFDIRTMKELYTFRGHKKEATAIAWHPIHESMFASGGSDGSLLFWQVGNEKEVASVETAHDSIVWSLAWHPLGHILASASNDHTTKFWTRNRPGDRMRDRYNLNMLPIGTSEEMLEFDDDTSALSVIPGMGLEHGLPDHLKKTDEKQLDESMGLDTSIPGLESSVEELAKLKPQPQRKVPYAKPIPADFQRQWDMTKAPGIAPQQAEAQDVKDSAKQVKEEEKEAEKMAVMVKTSGLAVAQAHQAVVNAMKNASENGGQPPIPGLMSDLPPGPPLMTTHKGMIVDTPPGLRPSAPSQGKPAIPSLMDMRLNGPPPGASQPPDIDMMNMPAPDYNQTPDKPVHDFVNVSPPPPPPEIFPGQVFGETRDEDKRGDVDLRQGFTDVDMRHRFHEPPPPNRFEGRFEHKESQQGIWENRTTPRDGPHQDLDMRQHRMEESKDAAFEDRQDQDTGPRRDELLDEDFRFSSGGTPGGQAWRQQNQQEGHQRDPFGGFDQNQESGPFGSRDKDLRGGGRFDQEFHSKGLLPHPGVEENNQPPTVIGDHDERGSFGGEHDPSWGHQQNSNELPQNKRTWNEGPGDDLEQEQFGQFGQPDAFGPRGRGRGNMWRGGPGDRRGMRGRGEPGMRGRGEPGMRGRGEPGMRGNPSGFRGSFRGGRGGMGRGGMGRGNSW
ncbi:pre-mRNA 3' end processing protein WDR33-like [Asterias rubens]|uniref:pre-mRNA 3' end processing protein WDR33-like n=1 Tax=Asterias rubens TaxID=7604 RepID=UPI0014553EB4|nr:pre-mRNA 3' end processing protein WDR33-like [Asterias rubens]